MWVDEGVTGGVSNDVGDNRPSAEFKQGRRCSWTLASLKVWMSVLTKTVLYYSTAY